MFRDFNLNEADFWSGSSVQGWSVNTFVPKLGHNMGGYTIDSIQLTVEDVREQVTNMGAALQYDAAFTVRIFGRAPEPASISLIMLGAASLLPSHRRCSKRAASALCYSPRRSLPSCWGWSWHFGDRPCGTLTGSGTCPFSSDRVLLRLGRRCQDCLKATKTAEP